MQRSSQNSITSKNITRSAYSKAPSMTTTSRFRGNNMDHSVRTLNTIEEVSEPGASLLNSNFLNSQVATSKQPQEKPNSPFFKKGSFKPNSTLQQKPIRTITVDPHPHGYVPPPLRPISQQPQFHPHRYSHQPSTWQKIKTWFQNCDCCKIKHEGRALSTAW